MIQLTELDTIKNKFQRLSEDRPSTIRTTIVYGPLGWIMRILGWLFFIIGVGLLIATGMGAYLFSLPDTDQRISDFPEAYQQMVLITQIIAGSGSLLIGIVLIFIGNLCRKIVARNIYILDLEEIFEEKEKL